MKMMIILGTRPEAIKLAPVIMEARADPDIDLEVVFTGQHADLVPPLLKSFGIVADHDLGVMRVGQSLSQLTSLLFAAIGERVEQSMPDVVVVQGDTTTAMVGAMVGFYQKISVCHVEAGLRTPSIHTPFPEEMNRRICTLAADIHCCPSAEDAENVRKVKAENITVTGNTIVDTLHMMPPSEMTGANRFVLVTCHRRENRGEAFSNIRAAIEWLANDFPDITFVWVTHPGNKAKLRGMPKNVRVIPPTTYATAIALIRHSQLVLTDSGGVMEESVSLGRPVGVLRESTERNVAVAKGSAVLLGSNTKAIAGVSKQILEGEITLRKTPQLFGDGFASQRVVAACKKTGPS